MKNSKSADYQHGAKGNSARITKASHKSDITPNLNLNPSLADTQDLPKEDGKLLTSPVG